MRLAWVLVMQPLQSRMQFLNPGFESSNALLIRLVRLRAMHATTVVLSG